MLKPIETDIELEGGVDGNVRGENGIEWDGPGDRWVGCVALSIMTVGLQTFC